MNMNILKTRLSFLFQDQFANRNHWAQNKTNSCWPPHQVLSEKLLMARLCHGWISRETEPIECRVYMHMHILIVRKWLVPFWRLTLPTCAIGKLETQESQLCGSSRFEIQESIFQLEPEGQETNGYSSHQDIMQEVTLYL